MNRPTHPVHLPPRLVKPHPFRRVLVANRGEIARRIFRTCRALGHDTVAVYSYVDRDSLHVREADQAFALGGETARESYLNIERLLEAAAKTGAEAIHPGYGFLSENDRFAEAVERAGLVFIGPHPETIRLMGSKIAAKELMERIGVPTVPGYHGKDQAMERLIEEGRKIGFPLLIKAAAGGGGKGMRVAQSVEELTEALSAARREAESAFGQGDLLLERYIPLARHIEVQIFGDHQGHVVHLFERECTVQRRHQKILEEAPALLVKDDIRDALHHYALEAARAVQYVGAGTVEFVLDPEGRVYFLEMNTRLQVEHPVTEAITGQDLVAWQLAIAQGSPLPLTQDMLTARGHAVEVRVYAEDPRHEFLPAPGRVEAAIWPEGCRLETAIEPPEEISPHYDPMIAKIITVGPTRQASFDHLARALDATALFGTITNLELLRGLAHDSHLRTGAVHTSYVVECLDRLINLQVLDPWLLTAAMLAADASPSTTLNDPWHRNGSGLPVGTLPRFHYFRYGGTLHRLRLSFQLSEREQAILNVDGQEFEVHICSVLGNEIRVGYRDVEKEVQVQRRGRWLLVHHADGALDIEILAGPERGAHHEEIGHTRPPFPGRVTLVRVTPGIKVEKGDALVTLEGMKMEYTVRAPYAGTISAVHVTAGQLADVHHPLVDIEPEARAHE